MQGLDADHISAIDNATRQLVSLGQLPITCGELESGGISFRAKSRAVVLARSQHYCHRGEHRHCYQVRRGSYHCGGVR